MNAPNLTTPRKMGKPERADYFRVFASVMLLDDDYCDLDRAEWGSVILLMLNQWAKGGTLPESKNTLARLAQCTVEELDALLVKWPKLKPIEGKPGRVGIPYLTREYSEVMAFYEDQKRKSELAQAARDAEAARKAGTPAPLPPGHPGESHGSSMGDPLRRRQEEEETREKDLDQDQEENREDPPAGGSSGSIPGSASADSSSQKEKPSLPKIAGLKLELNITRVSFSTETLNAAVKDPWSIVDKIMNVVRRTVPGLPNAPVGTLLKNFKSDLADFCEADRQWLIKVWGCAEYMLLNMPGQTGKEFLPSIGTLLKNEGKIINEYAAKYFHRKLTYMPILCEDDIYGWVAITYTGSYPGKNCKVEPFSHRWLELGDRYNLLEHAKEALDEDSESSWIYEQHDLVTDGEKLIL